MCTNVVNNFINSQTCLNINNEMIVDPILHVNFEGRVSENYETTAISQNNPPNVLSNVIDEQNIEDVSFSHTKGDPNITYTQSFKESLEINNNLSENSLHPEFEATLCNLKKASDSAYKVNEENYTLNFVDVFFGKLTADISDCKLNNTNENTNEDQSSILLVGTEHLPVRSNDQKILETKNTGTDIDNSIEINHDIENKCSFIENEYIEMKDIDSIVQESEIHTSMTNNEDIFKENTEHMESYTECTDNSLIGLEKQSVYNNTHINNNIEKGIEACGELDKTEHCFNNNPVFIEVNPSDDKNDSPQVNNKCSIAQLDTISISSTEDHIFNLDTELNDSYCSGYNSSDIEFITESEAELGGIISNAKTKEREPLKTVQIDKHVASARQCGPSRSIASVENLYASRSTSHIRDENQNIRRCEVPQGDDYLNLFRSIYHPVLPLSNVYYLENKSAKITNMDVEYDGIGFNMRTTPSSESESTTDDELKEDAMETRRKIISSYPNLNNRKRSYFFRNKH